MISPFFFITAFILKDENINRKCVYLLDISKKWGYNGDEQLKTNDRYPFCEKDLIGKRETRKGLPHCLRNRKNVLLFATVYMGR